MLSLILFLNLVMKQLEDVGGNDKEPVFLNGEGIVVLINGSFLRPQIGEYF